MAKKNIDNYESKVERLEKIIDDIQSDSVTLNSSLELYEEGIRLYKECKEHLEDTKEKIRILEEV